MQAIPNVGYARLSAHRMLLADQPRMEAFQRAIDAVVRPHHVVVDIGTGSGVLALFAARAGARKVYAIEREPMVEVAQRVAIANGLAERIEFIRADVATLAGLPERADVLISECVGSALVNTTMIEPVLAARARFLKPGGLILPRLGQLVACPVEVPVHDWYLRFWDRRQYGLDWREVSSLAANQLYTAILASDDLMAQPQQMAELDFASPATTNADLGGEAVFRLARNGTVHGLAVWFNLQLCPTVLLPTGPSDALTSWYQTLLPVDEPIVGRADDQLLVRLEARHVDLRVAWTWSVEPPGSRPRIQNSELSYPMEAGLPVNHGSAERVSS